MPTVFSRRLFYNVFKFRSTPQEEFWNLSSFVGAEDYTPELTKVQIHWKMPLHIHLTIPVKIHWQSDNPSENTTDK